MGLLVMKTVKTIVEVSKAQNVRLLDVFVIGPTMIATSQCKNINPLIGAIMLAAGVGTVLYNGGNYLENRKRLIDNDSN